LSFKKINEPNPNFVLFSSFKKPIASSLTFVEVDAVMMMMVRARCCCDVAILSPREIVERVLLVTKSDPPRY